MAGEASGEADRPIELEALLRSRGPEETKPPIVAPGLAPYNPAEDREKKRGQIAMRLVGLLIAITVAPFLLIVLRGICIGLEATNTLGAGSCSGFSDIDTMEVLQLVLTAVVALVGAATGFYFGEKAGSDTKG